MSIKLIPFKIHQHFSQIIGNKSIFTSSYNLKNLKKYIDYSKVPTVDNEDVKIQFVRGSGPGGQATNKTNNAVVMKHIPTGIVTKCHETRSQLKNQEIAKKKLINKLDILYNKENSVENQTKILMKKFSNEKKRRQKKNALLKAKVKLEQQNIEVERNENKKSEENESHEDKKNTENERNENTLN